ncbi:MAG TPA: ATP-binding protein, partial [Polyangiaceae bacterium LLY-WYZ-15_(1-7)]|nr:ATP-binding protein [Polyangiaceae bacterium LLY-WYZ-15_(1-7)]
MARPDWFELSHEGWQQRSRSRPLGRLLLEAVQNAFDAAARSVRVTLDERAIHVEDDASEGFADGRLVYTVFLSDKRGDPAKRGRLGRGLKELIAAMERARVETVGTTVLFDAAGRREEPNERRAGTRIVLTRRFDPDELEEARRVLRLCIAPKGTSLRVDGQPVRRPDGVLTLSSCELETVELVGGVERAVTGQASVALYAPRPGQLPHLFEMGVPLQAWDVPWHVDVHQRVPLRGDRDGVPERFELRLKALLLESMIHRYLETKDLRADWVHDVIGRFPVKTSVLDAYVSRAYPRGAVLGGTRRANDRARQLGAHVIDAASVSHGAYLALGRVVETADDYVRRRAAEFGGAEVEPDETQRRFAEAVRWLARRVAGRVVRVRFFA